MSHKKTRNKRESLKSVDDFSDLQFEEKLKINTAKGKAKKSTGISLSLTIPHKHSEKQNKILESMISRDTKIVTIDGFWGTSKSYLAVLAALQLLQRNLIKKIIYIRTPCESSNTARIGTLPGDLSAKMAGFNVVLEEKLEEFLDGEVIKNLFNTKVIECIPPGMLRGRNFADSVLICDEASNFSWEDILLICTRMGENTRMFMIGDSFQNDIGKKSGFLKFLDKINDSECAEQGIHNFKMREKDDIVRSGFIRFLMEKVGILNIQ
jgi:phosphate starvation-inducible protein PhoH